MANQLKKVELAYEEFSIEIVGKISSAKNSSNNVNIGEVMISIDRTPCELGKVIVTDKLKSYRKPIKQMCPTADHMSHKELNNRAENSHQPKRRKEKCQIKILILPKVL